MRFLLAGALLLLGVFLEAGALGGREQSDELGFSMFDFKAELGRNGVEELTGTFLAFLEEFVGAFVLFRGQVQFALGAAEKLNAQVAGQKRLCGAELLGLRTGGSTMGLAA
jgi:hypothetical protein